jgi:hypothetical protein
MVCFPCASLSISPNCDAWNWLASHRHTCWCRLTIENGRLPSAVTRYWEVVRNQTGGAEGLVNQSRSLVCAFVGAHDHCIWRCLLRLCAGSTESRTEAARHKSWRERMAQRQKYWSLSHGFKGGRKLAEWGSSEQRPTTPDEVAGAFARVFPWLLCPGGTWRTTTNNEVPGCSALVLPCFLDAAAQPPKTGNVRQMLAGVVPSSAPGVATVS